VPAASVLSAAATATTPNFIGTSLSAKSFNLLY
jgi:hypothetical protein